MFVATYWNFLIKSTGGKFGVNICFAHQEIDKNGTIPLFYFDDLHGCICLHDASRVHDTH